VASSPGARSSGLGEASPRLRLLTLLVAWLAVMPGAAAATGTSTGHPEDATALEHALSDPGASVELRSDDAGEYAYRVRGADGAWRLPEADAVLLDEAWWTPLRPLHPVPAPAPDAALLERVRDEIVPAREPRRPDRLTDLALGDVTADGVPELVLSFRRPFRRTAINITRPRRAWTDEHGLSAHVGLYRPGDLSEVWVAGTLTRPVTELAACQGALGVGYGTFDGQGTRETDAWRWVVFGFLPVGALPGPGTPICVDIDSDGRTEPAIIGRRGP
jgi:hypothetical protein